MKHTECIIFILTFVTGCAGAQLKSDWKERRGYSDADIAAIEYQSQGYKVLMMQSGATSNAFNSAPMIQTDNRLRAIFCSCVKKLGQKCREKSDGLAAQDKELWIKANAVDMAILGQRMTWEANPMTVIDPLECQ